LNRRQRAQLRTFGETQSKLRTDIGDLRGEVTDTLVFEHLHARIDEASQRVERQLTGGSTDPSIKIDQSSIARHLRSMAAALAEDQKPESFESGGGSGGGGGAGSPPPLIPPVAELKLLRGIQQGLYDTTRSLEGGEGDRETLLRLSTEQRELGTLGKRLIEQAEAAAAQGGVPSP